MGSPELPLLLSPLSEELTPELDVTSPTLLEPSTSPRGRLRLMPTTWEDMELDTPVWDTLVWDTWTRTRWTRIRRCRIRRSGICRSGTPCCWLCQCLSLCLCQHRRSCPCCCPRHRRTLRRSWTLRRQLCWNCPCCQEGG